MKKNTVNFQPEYKLWNACAKESYGRPVIEYVFFRGGYAYASNGNILVRVPLNLCTTFDEETIERLDGFAIHASILKRIVKYDKVDVSHEIIKRDGVEKVVAVLIAWKEENCIKVYLADNMSVTPPNFEDVLQMPSEVTTISQIGMYLNHTDTLTAAMGTKFLKMTFTKKDGKIFAYPVKKDNESVGVIMPLMLFEE